MTLHLDFETRATVDLKKTGVYVYAEHEHTDVWCAAYAMDDEPVKLWHPDLEAGDILYHLHEAETITAHNAAFERIISALLMRRRYGWPEIALERWKCTMAMCLAMALPAGLEQAAMAVKSPVLKDEVGGRLMKQMMKPRATKDGSLRWWDEADKRERLYAYCKQDVEAERALEKRILPLREKEQRLWFLDQKINDRGVHVDQRLCRSALSIVDGIKGNLDAEISRITETEVTGCTNRNQMQDWLRKKGLPVDSIAKDALDELLARVDLDPVVRRAIELRRDGARAASSKIDALMNGVSSTGRSQGMLQYHMTPTGRWGGRRFQPQNIVRPKLTDIDTLIATLATGDTDFFTMMYDNPLTAVGDSIRSLVKAAPGHRMMAGDFANIEGRVAAWYAGEQWKLEAFRRYDAGTGPDLYKVAYAKSFGASIETVSKEQRQIGKVMELSLQYQGGHGAFVQMAPNYGVVVDDLRPIVKANVDISTWNAAVKKYRPQNGFGMHPDTWAAIRILIDSWRAAHPNIRQAWYDLDEAAMKAVQNPGAVFSVGPVKFKKSGSFLFMQLPSGKAVVFPFPCIKEKKMPWTETKRWKDPKTGEMHESEIDVYKPCLCYKAMDDHNQWSDAYAYGGQLFNYVVQGTARDILVESMFGLEAAGYPIVLTVHDENVCEVPDGHGSLEEFIEIMATVPDFVKGCPIAVDGWEGERYRKA